MNTPSRTSRIAVLVSEGRHPVSGTPRWSRNDACALSLAQALSPDGHPIQVLHAGCESPATRDYLALGVKHLQIVPAPAGADIIPALADLARDADIILCGMRAEGQEDSGMLPYLLAQQLGRPLLPGALQIDMHEASATIEQFLPKGRRRRVEAPLPCVITVHPMAPLALKYAYAGTLAGKVSTLPSIPAITAGDAAWTVSRIDARPIRLAAQEKRSGHARMLSATMTESRAGVIVNQGSAQEKAGVVLEYLRKHGLIDY